MYSEVWSNLRMCFFCFNDWHEINWTNNVFVSDSFLSDTNILTNCICQVIVFLFSLLYICFLSLDAVPGPAKAQESGTANPVGTGARLGRRQHEESGSCALHFPGPHENRLQWGERVVESQCASTSSVKASKGSFVGNVDYTEAYEGAMSSFLWVFFVGGLVWRGAWKKTAEKRTF